MSRVHIVLEEVAELKRSMAENAELKELREQVASISSSVKCKTLKITSDILGLPVKPVCGNCSKNAGGPNDHAWVKAGIAHAAREGVNGALSMSHHINEFTVPPPKLDSITSNKKVINSYNLDIKSITPEKLGLSLDFCNNCGDRGCSLGIHYIVEDSPGEYRINYQFTWDTESNRKVSYDRKDGDWKSIENPNLTLLEPAKVLVQSAIFECSKPFNARGSRPTGNCGHSGVAGNCSCGRHQNNVKELIQAAFDRITRIS